MANADGMVVCEDCVEAFRGHHAFAGHRSSCGVNATLRGLNPDAIGEPFPDDEGVSVDG